MNCPDCGQENPEAARFCGSCGCYLSAAARCAACGHENPLAQSFCHACGQPLSAAGASERPAREPRAYTPRHLAQKILQSKSAVEGERKQVTVLFADVKGSMELQADLDPEQWHAILDRFFRVLTQGVHRFEGTVNQYTGDGIMALFGAPIAHEDHGQRACYAALHLCEEIGRLAQELKRERGLGFLTRIGINSGEVVVGKIGDDLRMDYTAQGRTVGLAARMEQLADPGKVYLTEHTAELVSGYFDLEALGAFEVPGSQRPVRVYELGGVGRLRTRLDVSRARGLSKFVGRADEMAALEAALERATPGRGQVVGMVAEAGVGKSRLCAEFLERCRARGVTTYETHGVAHGKAVPFLPMLQLFRAFFGIHERDDVVTAREKIAGRLLLVDEGFRGALPLVFDFLGVPDPERPARATSPEARQRQLLAVVRGVVEARAEREKTVALLEDLHWFDPGSEAFLEQLVTALPSTSLLLVLNYRPEYRASWLQKSYCQQLPLVPLGPEAVAELLRELLGPDPTVVGLAELVRERTGGNPFFVEEVVQSLVESGALEGARGAYRLVQPVSEIAVPPTVEALLAARVDRLAEREKRVLQTAAVIGKRFAGPILAHVSELSEAELTESLGALREAELVYEEALYPLAEYAFKHPLTRDVAYQSQLGERRRLVHGAVAQAIEALDGARLDERASLLAYHWEGAGDADQAARWHRRAAGFSGFWDLSESLRHWTRVRELLDTLPESPEILARAADARGQLLWFGVRRGALPERQARALFDEASERARRSGDLRSLARVFGNYAVYTVYTGHCTEGIELSERALKEAEGTGDLAVAVSARWALCVALYFAGHLERTSQVVDEGIELSGGDVELGANMFGWSPYLFNLSVRGGLRALLGRPDDGARDLDRALELSADERWARWGTAFIAHTLYVELCWVRGDPRGALAHARQAIRLLEQVAGATADAFCHTGLGIAHVLNEDWSDARAALEHSLEAAWEHQTFLHYEAHTRVWLARALLGARDLDGARAQLEETLAAGVRVGSQLHLPHAHLLRAAILRHADPGGSRDAIEDALRGALDAIAQTGARCYVPFVELERAEVARLDGDEAARRAALVEAQRLFTEMRATGRVERVARALARA